jgi:hypothetical protein
MRLILALAAVALVLAGCTEIDVRNHTAGPIVVFVGTPDSDSAAYSEIQPGQTYVTVGDQAGPYLVIVSAANDYNKVVKEKRDKLKNEIEAAILYGTSRPGDFAGLAADMSNLQDDLINGSKDAECSGTLTDSGTTVVTVTVSSGSIGC